MQIARFLGNYFRWRLPLSRVEPISFDLQNGVSRIDLRAVTLLLIMPR